jgi:hypothetical protein
MDTHNMLTDIAFHNLRCLRQYLNYLSEERYIAIVMDPDTRAEIKLEFITDPSKSYTPPTQLEIAPVIHFSFNQVFNLIRSRPSDYNSRAHKQIEGIHSLLDTAHCCLAELRSVLPNPEKTPILEQYSDDIGFKIDKLYEKNVNMTTCRYIFEPLYNILYYGAYHLINNAFQRTRTPLSKSRNYGRSYDLSDIAPKKYYI